KPAEPARAETTAAAATTPVPTHSEGELATLRPHPREPVSECAAHVPENADDETRVQALLDQANKEIERGQYAAAWTCADRASDLVPTSVEAHHLRGAS